jgi:sugar lactone lactonase YvrE
MGPNDMGGRTRAILFDRNNSSLMWAASVSGGIFRSPNGGRSWIPVNDQLQNLAINSLCMASNGAIYAGTGEGMYYFTSGRRSGGILGDGIFKSSDGGQTFTQLASTNPATNPGQGWGAVGKMEADPTDANRIYAATEDGLKVSDDAGASWTDAIPAGGQALDLAIAASGAIWVKEGQSIYYSATGDAGSFTEKSVSPAAGAQSTNVWRSPNRMRISVAPSDENYVYVLVTAGGGMERVYQTIDGGTTWTTIGTASALLNPINQAPFAVAIGVDPKDPERIMIAGLTLWEWSSGNGWFQIASQSEFSQVFYVHADIHEIEWRADQPSTVWVANDGGLFKSENDGFSWSQENKGYATIQFYHVAVGFDGSMLGGTQDNGTILIDPNSSLPKSGRETARITQPGGSRIDGDGADVAISHLDQEVSFKAMQYGRMGRSIDNGGEYSYFYGTRMASRYNAFSSAFADFTGPFELYEDLDDKNSLDSIEFSSDTLRTSIGFGNGGISYSGAFIKPQSASKFKAESFKVFSGGQMVVSDASGTLSGDGTGSFDAITGQYTVDFVNGTNLEIRASVAIRYDAGAIINFESLTGEIPLVDSLSVALEPGQSVKFQDPVQSMFAVGLTAFNDAGQPGNNGGGVWMARDVLSNRTATPEWWHIGALSDGEVPTSMVFSGDGDVLFVGTSAGRVHRFSNLINARTEESADVDINFLVNPPAASTAIVENRVIFTQSGRAITSIVTDHNDSERLIITLGNYGSNFNHVYYTEQATSATLNSSGFTAKDGDLPALPVYDAVFNYNDPNNGQVILGTDLGVFTTNDITASSVSWAVDNSGFANVPVFDLLQTRTVRYDLVNNEDFEGAIYAATHGRGIFKTSTTADYVGIKDQQIVEKAAPRLELEIYPNPAQNKVNVALNLESRSDLIITVRDLSGRLVKTLSVKSVPTATESLSLDVSTLNTGTYIVSLINGSASRTSKLVITK